MAYLAPIHRPSSVRHALKLRFLSPNEECVIVAKSSRLEIYTRTPDGLTLKTSRSIHGKITFLSSLKPASSPTEHLLVGTDRFNYFTLSWNPQTSTLETASSFVDTADKTGRDSQTQDRVLVDPLRRCMVLELYEGILTIIPVQQTPKYRKKGDPDLGSLLEPVPCRIEEMGVRGSGFLWPRKEKEGRWEKARFAVLFEDGMERVGVKVYEVETGMGQIAVKEEQDGKGNKWIGECDAGAGWLLPVREPAYGLIILSETQITYLDDVSHERLVKPLEEPTIFCAWTHVEDLRWLLADEYGRLYFLMLLVADEGEVMGWRLDHLGTTSRASCLVYLDGGCVFVGSHQGDSQVIQIREKGIRVMQTFANIAPILDFAIMDMGNREGESQTNEFSSGQARIVTGSGGYQDGTLRSVRSGVGLEELGSLGALEHITDLFSLQSVPGSEQSDTLVVSFINETRIFRFDVDGEVEEVDSYKSFTLSEGTLLATNISRNRLLQVTKTSAKIIDLEGGMTVASWNAPTGQIITAVSANSHQVALCVNGVSLVLLDLSSDLSTLSQATFGADRQIACIDLRDIRPDILVVGFWQSASVSILSTHDLSEQTTTQASEDVATVPRSVLLTQILPNQHPTLFIALANGHVVTFSVDDDNSLSSRTSIVLGSQQANLKALARGDGLWNVFATCENPSLIYGSEGRIVYSAVTAEKATYVCPFDSAAYPGAIAIASSDDLKIALVDTERTTHVQTLPIGDTVRRIAYSTELRAFGMGTIHRELRAGVEVVQSHFKLADEVVFKELSSYALGEDELVESVIRADLDDGKGGLAERFVVGTAFLDEEQAKSARGRIIVFEVTPERVLRHVAEVRTRGTCRSLAVLDGKIVAALVKTVVLYAFSPPHFSKIATYRTATAPIDLAVSAPIDLAVSAPSSASPSRTIAIADVMKSVSIIKHTPGANGEPDTLVEIARHLQIVWATAVAQIDENTFIESDAEGNLIVLHQNVNGVTADDKRRLEVTSEMCLGEMVNRIKGVDVAAGEGAIAVPRAFVATVEGSIYLLALIHPAHQDFLMRLQGNLAAQVQGLGHLPWNAYRAFRNAVRAAEEPFRFVDGELVERFLDLDVGMQERVLQGLGKGVAEVVGMVELLRRMH